MGSKCGVIARSPKGDVAISRIQLFARDCFASLTMTI